MEKREKIVYILTALSFLGLLLVFIPFLFAPSWYIWDAGYPPNLPTVLYDLLYAIISGVNVLGMLLSAALGIRALVCRPQSGLLLRVLLGIYPLLVVLFFLGSPDLLLYYCAVPFVKFADAVVNFFLLLL